MKIQARNLEAGQTIKVREVFALESADSEDKYARLNNVLDYGEDALFSAITAKTLKKSPTFKILAVEVKKAGSYRYNGRLQNRVCVSLTVEGMNEDLYLTAGQKVLIID